MGELPITEPHYAVPELPPGLELGVCDRHDIQLRQCMADEGSEMLRKATKCIIAALMGHMLVIEQKHRSTGMSEHHRWVAVSSTLKP